MAPDLLSQGVELMLVGMGTVFVFLTVLVGATTLMSTLVLKRVPADLTGDGPTDEELAAISAAISRHRARHRPNKAPDSGAEDPTRIAFVWVILWISGVSKR